MVEPTPFSPEELDRIEDALEGLERVDALDDPSSDVCDVLDAYRGILVTTRVALPLEDVPSGALAAVFAEARASVDSATPALTGEQASKKPPGFFERLRRSFLVPSLALAGTAGLVLWMARPQDGQSGIDSPVAMGAEAKPAGADDRKAEEKTAKADADKEAEAPPSPPVDAAAAAEPTSSSPIPGASTTPSPVASPLADLKPEPEPEAEPEKVDALNDDLAVTKTVRAQTDEAPAWSIIERADRARGDGDCAAARQDYSVATEDDDAGVRARAYAGLGLCNIQAGDDAGAEDQFARARGQDPGVATYIQAERSPGGSYRPTTKRKRKSKPAPSKPKASKKSTSMDQMSAPFK